jgi:hypothetical protein
MKTPAAAGPGKKLEWSKFGCNTCGGRLDPKYGSSSRQVG